MAESCADCWFSKRMIQLGTDGIYCRLEPPRNAILPPMPPEMKPMLVALWPQVDTDAWCGRYERDPLARTES